MQGGDDNNQIGRALLRVRVGVLLWKALRPEIREQVSGWSKKAHEAYLKAEEARCKRVEEEARRAALRDAAQNVVARLRASVEKSSPNQWKPKTGAALGRLFTPQKPGLDERWRELLRRVNVLLLIGGKGSGKSALAYLIAELFLLSRPVYVVGVPDNASSLLPNGIRIAQSIDDLPNGCVAVIDEAYLSHHARKSAADANIKLAAIVNLSRQRDQLLIFVTQEARQLDRGVLAAADMFVIREPSPLQAQIDRPELRDLISQATQELTSVEGEMQDWAFVHALRAGFTGLVRTRLPSFWKSELSTMYAGPLPAAGSRLPSELTRAKKIEEARRMRFEEGKSVRKIAPCFGVSPSTVHNWLNDYPYRNQ